MLSEVMKYVVATLLLIFSGLVSGSDFHESFDGSSRETALSNAWMSCDRGGKIKTIIPSIVNGKDGLAQKVECLNRFSGIRLRSGIKLEGPASYKLSFSYKSSKPILVRLQNTANYSWLKASKNVFPAVTDWAEAVISFTLTKKPLKVNIYIQNYAGSQQTFYIDDLKLSKSKEGKIVPDKKKLSLTVKRKPEKISWVFGKDANKDGLTDTWRRTSASVKCEIISENGKDIQKIQCQKKLDGIQINTDVNVVPGTSYKITIDYRILGEYVRVDIRDMTNGEWIQPWLKHLDPNTNWTKYVQYFSTPPKCQMVQIRLRQARYVPTTLFLKKVSIEPSIPQEVEILKNAYLHKLRYGWSYRKGDNIKWLKKSGKPDQWRPIKVGSSLTKQGEKLGVGWYSLPFLLPENWRGQPLLLELGKVRGADETYFNGHLIGSTGKMDEKSSSYLFRSITRKYVIPVNCIKKENNIMIRFVSSDPSCGLTSIPMLKISESTFAITTTTDRQDQIYFGKTAKIHFLTKVVPARQFNKPLDVTYEIRDMLSKEIIINGVLGNIPVKVDFIKKQFSKDFFPTRQGYFLYTITLKDQQGNIYGKNNLPFCLISPKWTFYNEDIESKDIYPKNFPKFGPTISSSGFPNTGYVPNILNSNWHRGKNIEGWMCEAFDFIAFTAAYERFGRPFKPYFSKNRSQFFNEFLTGGTKLPKDKSLFLEYHNGSNIFNYKKVNFRDVDWSNDQATEPLRKNLTKRLTAINRDRKFRLKISNKVVDYINGEEKFHHGKPFEKKLGLWAPYGASATRKWHQWLKGKYKTLKTLNDTYETNYKDFNDINLPKYTFHPLKSSTYLPQKSHVERIVWRDFLDFRYDLIKAFLLAQKKTAKDFDPTQLCMFKPSKMNQPQTFYSAWVGERFSDYAEISDVQWADNYAFGFESGRMVANPNIKAVDPAKFLGRLTWLRSDISLYIPFKRPIACEHGYNMRNHKGEHVRQLLYNSFGSGVDLIVLHSAGSPAVANFATSVLPAYLQVRQEFSNIRYTLGDLDLPQAEVGIYFSPNLDLDAGGGWAHCPGRTVTKLSGLFSQANLQAEIFQDIKQADKYKLIILYNPRFDREFSEHALVKLADKGKVIILDNSVQAYRANRVNDIAKLPGEISNLFGFKSNAACKLSSPVKVMFNKNLPGTMKTLADQVLFNKFYGDTGRFKLSNNARVLCRTNDDLPMIISDSTGKKIAWNFSFAKCYGQLNTPVFIKFMKIISKLAKISPPITVPSSNKVLTYYRESKLGGMVILNNVSEKAFSGKITLNTSAWRYAPQNIELCVIENPFSSGKICWNGSKGKTINFNLQIPPYGTTMLMIPYKPAFASVPVGTSVWRNDKKKILSHLAFTNKPVTERAYIPSRYKVEKIIVGNKKLKWDKKPNSIIEFSYTAKNDFCDEDTIQIFYSEIKK